VPPPVWSPDGERLAYYKTYSTEGPTYHVELWLHDFRTGKDRMLTDGGGYGETWSPDGRYLAYRLMQPRGVAILGPEGEVSQFKTGDAPEAWLAWAPDGRLIVSNGTKVDLLDPVSGAGQELRFNGEAIGGAAVWSGDVAGSPSDRYFAFNVEPVVGANGQLFRGNAGVYIADTETGVVTRIIDQPGVFVAGWLGG
jgi:hypothetical protein